MPGSGERGLGELCAGVLSRVASRGGG